MGGSSACVCVCCVCSCALCKVKGVSGGGEASPACKEGTLLRKIFGGTGSKLQHEESSVSLQRVGSLVAACGI